MNEGSDVQEQELDHTTVVKQATEHVCNNCEDVGMGFQRCSRCKAVWYCSPECQKANWTKHKASCETPEQKKKREEEEAVNEELKNSTSTLDGVGQCSRKSKLFSHF